MSTLLGMLAGGAVQAGIGAINNIWAQQQQAEARRENYMFGEMAAQNADRRTRALYNDFYSPEALMRQYKAAGLSPSMMFGGTPGQGGTSGAMGTGAAGPGALYQPISAIEGAQVAKLNAETENVKADTAIKKGEGKVGEATLENIVAQAGYTRAATELADEQKTMTELQNKITSATSADQIDQIKQTAELVARQAEQAWWIAKREEMQFNFESDTYKTRVEQSKEDLKKTSEEIIALVTQENVNEAQVTQIQAGISQALMNYLQEAQKINQQKLSLQQQWVQMQAAAKQFRIELNQQKELFLRSVDVQYDRMTQDLIGKGFDMIGRVGQAIVIGNVMGGAKPYTSPKTVTTPGTSTYPKYY